MARFVLTPASAPVWTLKSGNNRLLFNVLQDKRVEFQMRNSTLLSVCFFDAVLPKELLDKVFSPFSPSWFPQEHRHGQCQDEDREEQTTDGTNGKGEPEPLFGSIREERNQAADGR